MSNDRSLWWCFVTREWTRLLRLETQALEGEIDRYLAQTGEFPDFAWSSITLDGESLEWVIRVDCGNEPPEGAGRMVLGKPMVALYDLRAFKARTLDGV